MNIATNPWVWIAAICTLAMFSVLYKDNPFYKVAEHLFVGLALGFGLAYQWHNGLLRYVFRPLFMEGQWIIIIPMIIGLLYFTRLIPKASWMIRIPISISLGFGMGYGIPIMFQTYIFEQIRASLVHPEMFNYSFKELLNPINVNSGIWGLILLIGTLATLIYFYFSRKEKSVLNPVSQVGIVFIMIGFGATFGLTVMSRISLLIGRLQFLLRDWLGIIQ